MGGGWREGGEQGGGQSGGQLGIEEWFMVFNRQGTCIIYHLVPHPATNKKEADA
jgi:hypothetical protein